MIQAYRVALNTGLLKMLTTVNPSQHFINSSTFSSKLQKSQFCTVPRVPKYVSLQASSCVKSFLSVESNRCFSAMGATPAPDRHSDSKITRTTLRYAQKALSDYLHGTRGFHFTDADYVSKNSPVFLRGLLSRIESEEDVRQSLRRFLQYHPINEFEPFFESLGLKPAELRPFLPKNLMYLCDDGSLLENYQVLCDYGVPRSKIGKMYMEGPEMFRYDSGVLSSKLQDHERLGLSRPTIIKLVTCCPSLLVGDVNMEFLMVLEKLKSVGVELDWIRDSLSDKSTYRWNRIFETLNFLDSLVSDKRDLSVFVKDHARFVFHDSGKNIYMLVTLLLKLGLTRGDILFFFKQYPQILYGKFTRNLWRSVQFLYEIGMNEVDIATILTKHAHDLGSSSCLQSQVVLQNLKISTKRLCEVIKEDPSQFSVLTSGRKTRKENLPKVGGVFLKEKTDFLLRIGFVENSDEFTKVLRKFRGRGDQLQERFDCLVNAGLDCHTVSKMITSMPSILNQSTDVLQKKLDYLLNNMGYPVESVGVFPAFLGYNLEKIKLRFSMYKWVKENGVEMPGKKRKMETSGVTLSTLLACSEVRFFDAVVSLHPEGPNVWERLKTLPS